MVCSFTPNANEMSCNNNLCSGSFGQANHTHTRLGSIRSIHIKSKTILLDLENPDIWRPFRSTVHRKQGTDEGSGVETYNNNNKIMNEMKISKQQP